MTGLAPAVDGSTRKEVPWMWAYEQRVWSGAVQRPLHRLD